MIGKFWHNCDNVAVSDFLNFDISERRLRLRRDLESLQWRSSGSDSFPLCFGHFQTSYMKINCMKNSLKFSKTVWCNKNKKTNFVYVIIHHHVLQWFLPLYINRYIVKYPNWPLIALI